MKKVLIFVFAALIMVTVVTPVWAADDIKIFVDGKELVFAKNEQGPIMENGRVLVPLRKIFEELEYQVQYSPENQRIHIFHYWASINMKIGSKEAYVYSKTVALDVAPKIVNSSTLIPLRFAAENSRCDVVWDSKNRRVNITSQPMLSIDDYISQKLPLELNNNELVFSGASGGGLEVALYSTDEFACLIAFNYTLNNAGTASLLSNSQAYPETFQKLKEVVIQTSNYYQAPVRFTVHYYGDSTGSSEIEAKLMQTETNLSSYVSTSGDYNFDFLVMQYSPYTKNFQTQWYYQASMTQETIE